MEFTNCCHRGGGAAHVGEHNADVLGRWLGVSDEQVGELERAGALIVLERSQQ